MSVISNNQLAGAAGQGGDAVYKIERSLRFNSDDSAYLTRTPSSAGNRKTWTYSFWIKVNGSTGYQYYFSANYGGSSQSWLQMDNSISKLTFIGYTGGYDWNLSSSVEFRDPSAWYHIVISFDTTQATASNRVKWYVNGEQLTLDRYSQYPALNHESTFNTTTSHKLSDPSYGFNGYLADVHFIDGQALAPTDFGEYDDNNVWQPKEFSGSYLSGTQYGLSISNSTLNYDPAPILDGSTSTQYVDRPINNSTINITNLPAANTSLRIYCYKESGTITTNSGLVVAAGSSSWITPTSITYPFTLTSISCTGGSSADGWGVSAIEIDGSIITQGDGANSFYLNFSDNSSNAALGTDSSGNSNTWTVNNLSVASGADNDSLIDTPTNYEATPNNGGNYATLNSLNSTTNITLSNGNLDYLSSSSYTSAFSTIGMSSGKWYFEGTVKTFGADSVFGISNDINAASYTGGTAGSYGYEAAVGAKYHSGGASSTGYSTYTIGDVISCAFDADNGKVYFAKNGVWQESGNPADGTNPAYSGLTALPYFFGVSSGSTGSWSTNFGQRPFAYTPPTGYKSLCATNLPEPTIADGSTYFDTTIWSGDSTTPRSITTGFEPDLVWIKARNATYYHTLYDSVRTASAGALATNTTEKENGPSNNWAAGNGTLSSFDSTGYTLTGSTSANYWTNRAGITYVGWAWDAGTSNTSISAGGLNSSVYDQSQTWSNYLTCVSGFYSGYPATYAFNATYGFPNMACNGTSGDTLVYTHPVATTVTSLRFRFYAGQSHTITVAGQSFSVSNVAGSPAWTEVLLPSGGISLNGTSDTISVAGPNWNYVDSIEINGKELIDSGVSVTNVPTIASTVRANPSAGFSIVKWTGSSSNETVAHGLNAKPDFMICKKTSVGGNSWVVWHKSIANDKYLILNAASAEATDATLFNSHANDSSSVFSLGTNNSISDTSQQSIAYLFSEIEGYSAFGSYSGNGSDDGPFVYTGFTPAFIITKAYSSNSNNNNNWAIYDTTRVPNNENSTQLYPNSSAVEGTHSSMGIDILSNGFKLKADVSGYSNYSGWDYIYVAFAEHPFKTARAR